jgi:hypothetical protein
MRKLHPEPHPPNLTSFRPVFEQVGRFQQSVAKYPNIKTGEDFKGYQ